MVNYIKADLYRILHKQSFFGVIGTYIALFVLLIFILFNPTFTGAMYVSKIYTFLDFFPLIIGLIIFVSLYVDDVKSNSIQIAIGYGLPRYKIILSKLLECFTLLIITSICISLLVLITPILLEITIDQSQAINLLKTIFMQMIKTISYISISQILIYHTTNSIDGMIMYLLLSTQVIYIVFNIFLEQKFIVDLCGYLNQYLLTNELYICLNQNFLTLRMVGIILLYILLPVILSIVVFQEREY